MSAFDPNSRVMVLILASEESSPRYQHHDPTGGINFDPASGGIRIGGINV